MAASTSTSLSEIVFLKLKELNIPYEVFQHSPLRTAEELVSTFKDKPYQAAKNIFVADKKKKLFVLTTPTDRAINLKTLSSHIPGNNFRLGNEESMKKHLHVTPGSVTPLACLNDVEKRVTFVLDAAFKKSTQPLLVHPLHNTETIALSLDGLLRVIEHSGHEVHWVDFSATEPAPEASAPKTQFTKSKVSSENIPQKSSPVQKRTDAPKAAPAALGTEMLGITFKKEENLPEWYSQVITRAELVEYYDVSGCYILRPSSYFIWESIQDFINTNIKALGVKNCYFPMFVTQSKLETEAQHIEGFSPEVAWVTKYGDSELCEPIAIRPTSETIMYPAFARWIRSHRDLPLQLNQWCQVVRWEFKQPTPFIRTREFLWQEGHTAHATDEEAYKMTLRILDLYARVYEELLAVPVIKGIKSEKEKFAGGHMTTTVEAFIPTNGRAVQAATSHHLSTNFSKMFNIEFEDQQREKKLVHQTSWGLTTRSIGVAIMVHGDDKGMVMPPRVAPLQVIIVPIVYKGNNEPLLERCQALSQELSELGVRNQVDDRDNYTPGWKYNHWETKGVCLRMELGPRDISQQTVRVVRRDTNEKVDLSWASVSAEVPKMLSAMHTAMLDAARARMNDSIAKVTEWSQVMPALNSKKMILAPWCEETETEEAIKQETTRLSAQGVVEKTYRLNGKGEAQLQRRISSRFGVMGLCSTEDTNETETCGVTSLTGAMKSLCIPFNQEPLPPNAKCFFSGKPAKRWCLFGRSY